MWRMYGNVNRKKEKIAHYIKIISIMPANITGWKMDINVAIVKEMQSSIMEMERENLLAEQILDRAGEAKDLVKTYLRDPFLKEKGFIKYDLSV